MKEIQLKGKQIQIEMNAAAVYRFSSMGGNVDDTSPASNFASTVLITWAMLQGAAKDEYKHPEQLASLFLPIPNKETLDLIADEAAKIPQIED